MSLPWTNSLFRSTVEAVQPANRIESLVKVSEKNISIGGRTYSVERGCYLVGFGKAVMGMARELEAKLGDRLQGGLALLSSPTPTVSFILSDIIGDPLDLISSGPTVRNVDGEATARTILTKYGITPEGNLEKALSKQRRQPEEGDFAHVQNVLIGNIDMALDRMVEECAHKGYKTVHLANDLQGDVSELAEYYKQQALKHIRQGGDFPLALIGGGEPTVKVTGRGKGGRNQELAVRVAMELDSFREKEGSGYGFTFMSAGTDGIDGPTDAAGAIVSEDFAGDCFRQGLDLEASLQDNDTNTLLSAANGGENLVKIGHTGTNVMDVHCLLIHQKMRLASVG